MQVTFPSYDAFKYVEVFMILERRNGRIFRTQPIGFALKTRPMRDDEVYAPLSMNLLRQDKITLELME